MLRFLLIVLMIVGSGAGAYVYYYQQQTPLLVKISPVTRGGIESQVRISGKTVNDQVVKLAALLDGEINRFNVNVGDHVEKGQLLITFDNTINVHRIKRASAKVRLEVYAVKSAESQLKRLQKLSQSGADSREKLDQAETELHMAQARLAMARESLTIEKLRQDKTKLYAPYSGVVTEKLTGVGQWTKAGTRLLKLASDQGLEVEAQVDAGDFLNIKTGNSVLISADSHPNQAWTGTIRRVSPAVSDNDQLNTFPVRITLGESAPKLLLNQQVDIKLTIAKKEDILKLPLSVLLEEDGRYKVMTVEGDRVRYVDIKTGVESYTHVEVSAGIDADTVIVVPDSRQLKEGEIVSVNHQAR